MFRIWILFFQINSYLRGSFLIIRKIWWSSCHRRRTYFLRTQHYSGPQFCCNTSPTHLFILVCLETGFHWLTWNSFCRPGKPQTQIEIQLPLPPKGLGSKVHAATLALVMIMTHFIYSVPAVLFLQMDYSNLFPDPLSHNLKLLKHWPRLLTYPLVHKEHHSPSLSKAHAGTG